MSSSPSLARWPSGARALCDLELAEGYGVEMGMLFDISRRFGTSSIAQVDLDVRVHRNRPLHELAPAGARCTWTSPCAAPGCLSV